MYMFTLGTGFPRVHIGWEHQGRHPYRDPPCIWGDCPEPGRELFEPDRSAGRLWSWIGVRGRKKIFRGVGAGGGWGGWAGGGVGGGGGSPGGCGAVLPPGVGRAWVGLE